jgi:hypothetical protein
MELKPSRDKLGTRLSSKATGVGSILDPLKGANPFGPLARGLMPKGYKRRRWASDTLGATPKRDGPFAPMASVVAPLYPPRGRQRRNFSAPF